MFHTIKSKLIVAVALMAALLAVVIYLSSQQLAQTQETLGELQDLQEFYTHTLVPQKDMNQFIGAIDNTVLYIDLGDQEGAQAAYEVTLDAELDIAEEFASLEEHEKDEADDQSGAEAELIEQAAVAHAGWEGATEFMKLYAEQVAEEAGMTLVRPSTEPSKAVDVHTDEAANEIKTAYSGMSVAELQEVADNNEVSPVEIADEAIDGLAETTAEELAAENEAGTAAITGASQTVLFGSAAVLVLVIVIGLVMTTGISRPLISLKTGAEAIAAGNLDYEFKNVPSDEVGSVIHSVEAMARSLKARILNLEEIAGVVMLTGEEISGAADQLDASTPQVQTIRDKAKTLRDLVGQALAATKK